MLRKYSNALTEVPIVKLLFLFNLLRQYGFRLTENLEESQETPYVVQNSITLSCVFHPQWLTTHTRSPKHRFTIPIHLHSKPITSKRTKWPHLNLEETSFLKFPRCDEKSWKKKLSESWINKEFCWVYGCLPHLPPCLCDCFVLY